MLHRLRTAWSAFCWAWKHFDPVQDKWMSSPRHIENWMNSRMSFEIGDFSFIKGKPDYERRWVASNIIPNSTEPFMLKKHVIDKDGRVRYFSVVPDGYDPVICNFNWEP